VTSPEPGRFLAELERVGWFESLPPEAAASVRVAVTEASAQGLRPYVGLASVVVDSEYLLSDRPYSALLRQFASATHGAFAPEGIEEQVVTDKTLLRFKSRARPYELELPAEADEVPASFFTCVNRALEDLGSPLRFFEVRGLPWRPIPGFCLTTAPVFERAIAEKLLAGEEPSEGLTDDELEGHARRLEAALLGTETYYWTIDGCSVAELRVPSSYEVQEADARGRGRGFSTILVYAGYGSVTMGCEPRSESPVLPRSLEVTEERRSEERLIRVGRTRIAKQEMRWRIDSLEGTGVLVACYVVERMADPFLEAVASFRLLESTPEIAAVLASCRTPPEREPRRPGAKTRERR